MPFIINNGTKIAYEEYGEGPPLILIMGLSAPGAVWELHINEYKKNFRCIAVDNRGAGQSDKPSGPYTTRMMADDIAALVKELKLEKVHVAGISMGGAIAQKFTLSYPGLVSSLVLISTWAKFQPYEATCFSHLKDMRKVSSPADFVKLLQLWIFSPAFFNQAGNLESLIQGREAAHENYMELAAFCSQAEACINHDALEDIHKISVPTLITVGEKDIFTPLHYAQQINEKITHSEICIFKDYGHAHHWEDLEKFNKVTAEFMKKHTDPIER